MAKDFHSATVVAGYDSHIRKPLPGYRIGTSTHQCNLSSHLPETAQVLVVGCGTGYELQYLLQQHPQWQFTAINPSLSMLQQAKKTFSLWQGMSQYVLYRQIPTNLPSKRRLKICSLMRHWQFWWRISASRRKNIIFSRYLPNIKTYSDFIKL